MGAVTPVFCTVCNSRNCGHLRLDHATLLTPREVDVLRALCSPANAGNKEIAAALHLDPVSVKVNLTRIYKKLGLPPGSGRAILAVLWAMAHHEELQIELPKREDFMWRKKP